MTTNANLSSYEAILNEVTATELLGTSTLSTSVLNIFPTMRMSTRSAKTIVRGTTPTAGWVNTGDAEGVRGERRKPYVKFPLEGKAITAEEVAFVAAIPEEDFADVDFDLEGYLYSSGADSLITALNTAVLSGENSPFASAGVVDGAVNAGNVVNSTGDIAADALAAAQMLSANGWKLSHYLVAGDVSAVINSGTSFNTAVYTNVNGEERLWGTKVIFVDADELDGASVAAVAADNFRIGIREDVNFKFDASGVIVKKTGSDALTGDDIISSFNDDVIAFRGKARFGFLAAGDATHYPAAVVLEEESV